MHNKRIIQAIQELSSPESYNTVYHEPKHGSPMPSTIEIKSMVDIIREIIFPGYFGHDILQEDVISYYTGVNIDKLFSILSRQIQRGLCFACDTPFDIPTCTDCNKTSEEIAVSFIERLPEIRKMIAKDILAAYNGDPAAKSIGEIIFCYPSIRVLLNYRIAHELVKLQVPLIPRVISELGHAETGIDIHPEAQIGESFSIDHGTGVVIGATCIIGNNVQLYQGVTLGAKNFPLDENGCPIKGIPRHPIVEDNVVVYSNATILGRITIGQNAIIGANVWVTNDVAAGERIIQSRFSS